jgi:glycosyltransferase involved in cell wall biosynthesis
VTADPKRVTLVTDELLGYSRTGGLGTATSFLAVGLARMGHDVDLLHVGEPPPGPLAGDWGALYDGAGVTVRPLQRGGERTEPPFFARARDVDRVFRGDPPDVVITQDLAAPAYTALRLRQLGLALERTLFVVYCHGTRQWITDVAGKVRVLPGALAISVVEQASIELADVVVSPSAYLLDWMRRERWRLPERSLVIPYLTRSAATGEQPQLAASSDGRVRRLAFFGRLEERKGIAPFAAGLNAIDAELLRNVEVEFVGRATPAWPPERVLGLLSDETQSAVRGVSFATDLDQPAALARISRPGTLAVMPSLEDNSPNAVYECLERGLPFIASSAGGIAELVAPEDRDRVLFEPAPEAVAVALRRALSADVFPPARFAFEPRDAYAAWAEVVTLQPSKRGSSQSQSVAVERGRNESVRAGQSDWVVLLDPADQPDESLVEVLARAQEASGADIVTCGLTLDSGVQHYFLGEPGALGLLSNAYGTVALIRRSLLDEARLDADTAYDPDWPLLARLVLSGASIVSVPETLVRTSRRPRDVQHDPAGALAVLQEFEHSLPSSTRSLARLAAGLAAQAAAAQAPTPTRPLRRLSRLLPRR